MHSQNVRLRSIILERSLSTNKISNRFKDTPILRALLCVSEISLRMSLLGTDACESIVPPAALSYTTATLSAILGLVTTLGNSLVLLAIVIDPNKDLRRPFNCFVFNLALADLLVGVCADPLSVLCHVVEGVGGTQPASELLHARNMTFFISCTASLLSLAALAVDRYTAITAPLKYRATANTFRAVFISVAIWLVTVPFTCIYFLVGYNIYRFVFANTAVLTTFGVIVFTYVKIFKAFRAQVRHWDKIHESTLANHAKKLAMKWEEKMIKTVVVVLALFIACYLPSCVFVYIINLCVNCGCVFVHWIRDLQFVLVLINSALNPIVYAWRLKNFRRAFARILTCRAFVKQTRRLTTTRLVSLTTRRHRSYDVSTTTTCTTVI